MAPPHEGPPLREGLPLHAVFVHPDEGESYPVFEPDAAGGEKRPGPGEHRDDLRGA